MADFFNEKLLEETPQNDALKNTLLDLSYHLREFESKIQLFVEQKRQRINQSEIQNILDNNELPQEDVEFLNFHMHKLGIGQTITNVTTDIKLVFSYLKKVETPIYFNGSHIEFADNEIKLDIELLFDEFSNIEIHIKNEGMPIFGLNCIYFLEGSCLYELPQDISLHIYRELFNNKNKFSIESFLNIKETLLPMLKKEHNVTISKEVEDLSSQSIKKEIAQKVVLIGKTDHFISCELKYKIGEEYYPCDDYSYLETGHWVNSKHSIKTVKTQESLIEYKSDLSLAEDSLFDCFQSTRVRVTKSPQKPFRFSIPMRNLDNFINQVLPNLEEKFTVEYRNGEQLDLRNSQVHIEIENMLNLRLNLLEFKVGFSIEGKKLTLDDLKKLMLQNKKYVQLDDNTTINIDNIREIMVWLEFLSRFEFQKHGKTYKTESKVALELDEFLKSTIHKHISSNEEYKTLIRELKDRNPLEEIELPKHIEPTLRDYQKDGVYWLYFLKKYGFGGILADEMGLGKTIQTLTILHKERAKDPHLVVCPKSLIYNWEHEIKTFFPDQKILIIDKNNEKRQKLIPLCKNYDIVITSYSMLQKDFSIYLSEKINFNYMVLDEAHYVKNMKTLSSKAVRTIPANHKLLLTGTPIENNLDELYGTFELVMPGYLGSKVQFKKEFVSKIERNNRVALEILQAKIKPFILRRTKSQVLKELPEKQEQIAYNQMTNKQVAVYKEILNRVKKEVNTMVQKDGFDKSRLKILSALLRLRQICNHPGLMDKEFLDEEGISGKYEQFNELLMDAIESQEKVLVFSQFTSMLDIIEKDFKEKKVSYMRLDGSTQNRQEVVNRFNNDPEVKVFLISLKAGGVGLNLTSASAVFLYDPWWNPMVEKQAVDRAHRIGQTKRVNIYKFITKDSIEDKILKLQERKGALFENLVEQEDGFFKRLEWEDLMELFE